MLTYLVVLSEEISDMADGTNNESCDEFEKKASKLSAEMNNRAG